MIMRKPGVQKCPKEKYVSCIRINGVPILPPLITPEKCSAIKHFRKQAMKVERQIQERKKALHIKQQKVHTVENTDFTETILDCCRNIETYLSTTFDNDSTLVDAQKHAPKLTCDIQASQYLNNELVLFDSMSEDCKFIDIDKYQKCDEISRPVQRSSTPNFRSNKMHESLSNTPDGADESLSLRKSLSSSKLETGFPRPWLDEVSKLHDAYESFDEYKRNKLQRLQLRESRVNEEGGFKRVGSFERCKVDAVNIELPNVVQRQILNVRNRDVQQNHVKNKTVETIKMQPVNQNNVEPIKTKSFEQIKNQHVNQIKVEQIKNPQVNQNKVEQIKSPSVNIDNEIKYQLANKYDQIKTQSLNKNAIEQITIQPLKQSKFVKDNANEINDTLNKSMDKTEFAFEPQNQFPKVGIKEAKLPEHFQGYNQNQPNKEQSDTNYPSIGKTRVEEIIQAFEKPQLIRSNSYVLETPSPVLLEHLKKNKDANVVQRFWSSSDNIYTDKRLDATTCDVTFTKETEQQKCNADETVDRTKCVGDLNLDLSGTKFEDYATRSNDKECEVEAHEALEYVDSELNVTKCGMNLVKPDECENTELNSTCSVFNFDTSCTETELRNMSDRESDSGDDDKLRQFIDNNVPKNDEVKNTSVVKRGDKNDSLKEILRKIPEVYSKKIMDYLEKHNEDFGPPQSFSTPNQDVSHNQTVYYSVDDDSKIGDYLNQASKELDLSKELSLMEYSSMVVYDVKKSVSRNNTSNKMPVKEKSVDEEYERYQKAASIIGAAAKGFLTRRLFKTEKVQNLIDVINEALMCAVELHTENLENINEYDVELHRRLIQQVSAACYAFHDVFFNTPIPEQMSIIALDTQKKRRPPSIQSARSTPRRSTKTFLSSTRSTSAV